MIEMGVQFHGTWAELSDDDRAKLLDAMVAAGMTWVRIDVGWSMIQPHDAASYDLAWGVPLVDKVLAMASERGLKILATLWQTPAWASGGNTSKRVLPTKISDFTNALMWAAARWQTQVQAWEIWNEPNSPDFLTPPDATAYAKLLKASKAALAKGNPLALCVFGGTMFVDTDWIQQVYLAAGRSAFDVMAVHPYQGRASAPPEQSTGAKERMLHLDALVALMATHRDAKKPIWLTEFGWSTHANDASTPIWALGVDEQTQAAYLGRSLAMLARWPQVAKAFWYTSRDLATGNVHQDNRGLLRRDFTAKPALAQIPLPIKTLDTP